MRGQFNLVSVEFDWGFWALGRQNVAGMLTVWLVGPLRVTRLAVA